MWSTRGACAIRWRWRCTRIFPTPATRFLQGENGRDLPDIFKPNEEINAIEQGRHYGWPYCYDLSTPSPEFRIVLQSGVYKSLCTANALYKPPFSLMPPHGAPLAMLYYHGAKFPELEGKLLVGLHGYRPTGSRVLVYDVDDHGFPMPARRRCATMSVARPSRPAAFRPTPVKWPPHRSTN